MFGKMPWLFPAVLAIIAIIAFTTLVYSTVHGRFDLVNNSISGR